MSNPTSISGCVLWLDGADSSTITQSAGSVSQWNDKSGSGNNVTSVSGNGTPTFTSNAVNGKSALTFGSTVLANLAPTGLSDTGQMMFIVIKHLDVTNGGGYGNIWAAVINNNSVPANQGYSAGPSYTEYAFQYDGEVNNQGGSFSLNDVSLVEFDATNGAGNGYVNGTSIVSISQNSVPIGTVGLAIGAESYNSFTSFFRQTTDMLCEIIIYQSAPNSTDRQTLEGYLAWKWGIQGNLPSGHPYYSAAPAGWLNSTYALSISDSSSMLESLLKSAATHSLTTSDVSSFIEKTLTRAASHALHVSETETSLIEKTLTRAASHVLHISETETSLIEKTLARTATHGLHIADAETSLIEITLARTATHIQNLSDTSAILDHTLASIATHSISINDVSSILEHTLASIATHSISLVDVSSILEVSLLKGLIHSIGLSDSSSLIESILTKTSAHSLVATEISSFLEHSLTYIATHHVSLVDASSIIETTLNQFVVHNMILTDVSSLLEKLLSETTQHVAALENIAYFTTIKFAETNAEPYMQFQESIEFAADFKPVQDTTILQFNRTTP